MIVDRTKPRDTMNQSVPLRKEDRRMCRFDENQRPSAEQNRVIADELQRLQLDGTGHIKSRQQPTEVDKTNNNIRKTGNSVRNFVRIHPKSRNHPSKTSNLCC